MKKLMFLVLTALSLLGLCACGKEETTTLMIYMVGSDLEAKAGAATKDLQEIAQSGVDLDRVNVLVFAGGTPNWHNEAASAQEHRILQLTPEGFRPLASTKLGSMGESGCLTKFLNFAWENMPADRFALILWNHGDGPVMGYGRDMLFDNDSLTLQEMAQALESSPFGPENKLSWVGFDACLMASAELCCTWGPYADYLVASQEVEPSFGWNYSALQNLGREKTPEFLENLTKTYLSACEEYYAQRGYGQRDITLSCADLSYAPALQEAINGLFAQARTDSRYHALAACRVETRALGRTTTGSEYDLIDLWDLSLQMGDLYPAETEQLQQVLDKMVVTNTTNAQNCCGMSLYYPFYNKSYYTESWKEIYTRLGLFPAYGEYLEIYEQQWLANDLMDTVASSQLPQQQAGTYTLQLTPEQNESLASVRYYILIRDGEKYYTKAFSSENVTNKDGLLTANFDGNIIYVRDNYGLYHIPVTKEHDTVGDCTRYSAYVTLTNFAFGTSYLPEDFEKVMEPYRFSLTLDNRAKTVTMDGIIPYDPAKEQDKPAGGKYQDARLEDWQVCLFANGEHRFLTRNEKGTVLGYEQWPADTVFSGMNMPVENGISFVYAPLAAGEYFLLFEVEDTQGNRYCSELLPIEIEGQLPQAPASEPWAVDFSQGDRVQLAQKDGVTVNLLTDKADPGYRIEVINQSQSPVRVTANNLRWGEDLHCDGFVSSVTAQPGETAYSNYSFNIGYAPALLEPAQETGTLGLELTAVDALTGTYLLYSQRVEISLSKETWMTPELSPYLAFDKPVCDALAYEQVLLENERMHVTLMGLGSDGETGALRGVVCVENRTDKALLAGIDGVVLNGIFAGTGTWDTQVPGKTRMYQSFEISKYQLETLGITSVGEAELLLREETFSPLFSGNSRSQLTWCQVKLGQKGTVSPFPEGETVLMDQEGIRVTVLNTETTDSKRTWTLSVINRSGRDISLDAVEPELLVPPVQAGIAVYPSFIGCRVGAGQCAVVTVDAYFGSEKTGEALPLRFRILDFMGEAIAFYSENVVLWDIYN